MAISVTHTIRLTKISPADPKACPFIVLCSCQWEGRAHTRQVADRWVASHTWAQTQRGNEVIIEIDGSAEPPVEAAPEQPIKVDANV